MLHSYPLLEGVFCMVQTVCKIAYF
jgi:hypothetical protein